MAPSAPTDLHFPGAATTVTDSQILLTTDRARVLSLPLGWLRR